MNEKICHPRGKDRGRWVKVVHGLGAGVFEGGTSRNGRPVMRIEDENGVLQTYRIFRRKSVKFNRLPRGFKRRTGVWNGQNVADMVSARGR